MSMMILSYLYAMLAAINLLVFATTWDWTYLAFSVLGSHLSYLFCTLEDSSKDKKPTKGNGAIPGRTQQTGSRTYGEDQ